MSTNPVDAAFADQAGIIEAENVPARNAFDELVRIVNSSQIPAEKQFGYAYGHDQIAFARGDYIITARLSKAAINVTLSCPDGSDYARAMCGATSSLYEPTTDAAEAARQIGSLMARVVEDRIL